jgi:hypothetical protein
MEIPRALGLQIYFAPCRFMLAVSGARWAVKKKKKLVLPASAVGQSGYSGGCKLNIHLTGRLFAWKKLDLRERISATPDLLRQECGLFYTQGNSTP